MIRDLAHHRGVQILVAFICLSYGIHTSWTHLREAPRAGMVQTLEERSGILGASHQAARCIMAEGGMDRVHEITQASRQIAMTLERYLPPRDEETPLLERLTELARTAGLEVTSLSPSGTEEGDGYERTSYQISVRGAYWPIATYLASIADQDQFFQIVGFRASVQTSPEDPGPTVHSASFTIEAFRALDGQVRVADLSDGALLPDQGDVRYERGPSGDLWQVITIADSPDPVRIPVPAPLEAQAEQWLQQNP